jgi:hypothetical protein
MEEFSEDASEKGEINTESNRPYPSVYIAALGSNRLKVEA